MKEGSSFSLNDTYLLQKPTDVLDDHIAYNPSAIWTVEGENTLHDVMYVRVEPNHSGPDASHIGKTVVRPYVVEIGRPDAPIRPYDDGIELKGEDPALTRINRRLASGAIESVWLLSCVVPVPELDRPNNVATLQTRFYAGTSLGNLEEVGRGPEWMKDIRVVSMDPSDTKLGVYGRPQPQTASGNVSYTTVPDIDHLTPDVIAGAPFIDDNLFPVGSGQWGGANDVIRIDQDKNLILAHRAEYVGADNSAKRYEALLLEHRLRSNTIVVLGVLATSKMFPKGTVKEDETTDLSDVVFPGGGYNGKFSHVSFGLHDACIGIGCLG